MADDLQIRKDITRNLLDRITSPSVKVREGAVEALAVSTGDEDWRPNELIRQGGIEIIASLLHDKNTHIVVSALDIIIATAAAGEGRGAHCRWRDRLARPGTGPQGPAGTGEGPGGALAPGARSGRGGDFQATG